MGKTAKQWKDFYRKEEFQKQYCDPAEKLGMECISGRTSFRLWSPVAEEVQICFYKNGEAGSAFEIHPMQLQEHGIWNYETKQSLHGIYYDFLLKIEGEQVQSADPYAKACGVNGLRSMAVDLRKTDPVMWESDKAPEKEAEQIIYELHVKEFSWDASGGFPVEVRGKYPAFCCKDTSLYGDGKHPTGLSYLKNLGVNYVQLMPVYDYGSVDEAGRADGFNWGYDPLNYNVPEGSYSTDPFHGEVRIRELKEAIQALHRQGFRVIMDVVYNHTYSLDSWLQKTMPWYFYRVWEDGSVSNGSACGNDVASEQAMCAKYILESVLYWAEEYHMDGFRFDLMGLLDVELMNRIRKELDARYGTGEKLVFGEPWRADETAVEGNALLADKAHIHLLDEQVGMFSDDTRDAIKGSVFEAEEPGFANGGKDLEEQILASVKAWCGQKEPKVKAPSQVITYVSAHDNHTLWDKLCETTASEELRRKQYRLAAGMYLTCQGIPFLLSGEEFARTKGGRDNTYNAPITINRLDWEQAYKEQELVEYYRGLITLRKMLPGLWDKSAQAAKRILKTWKTDGCVGLYVDNQTKEKAELWKTLCIVYNGSEKQQEVKLLKGTWEVLTDGEDSFLWKHPQIAAEHMKVSPVSILILGKKEESR